MSRRSNPLQNLSWPSLLIAVVIIGCRQWQASQTPPKKSAKKPAATRSSQRPDDPRTSPQNPVSLPSGESSNEGNLLFGNPTGAARDPDNFLLERAQYSFSYNLAKGGPNWVAWHTDESNLGDLDRGKFAPDPDLPAKWRIRPTDYKNSGYDRGHVCPSGDRTASREDNNATFYMSNMLPQTGALNRHVWADFESYVRTQIRAGNEAYQIAGGAGSSGTIADGKVNIPQVCWKIVVLLPVGSNDLRRVSAKTRVIAVEMQNIEDPRLETGDWHSFITTMAKIEKTTKFNLLSALPSAVHAALAQKNDADS